MENKKKGGARSLGLIAFCVVILLLLLYAQYLINQQTKVSMIQMAQWQSSIEEEYGEGESGETESQAEEADLTEEK